MDDQRRREFGKLFVNSYKIFTEGMTSVNLNIYKLPSIDQASVKLGV